MIKRRSLRYEIEAETVQLTKDGGVEIMCKEEFGRRQTESEIMQRIGVLLQQCLSKNKQEISQLCRRNNDDDLIELVSGLANRKFDEQDEGYEGDFTCDISHQSASNGMRQFRYLEDICVFCNERLHRKNIASGSRHYQNVIRALYYESYELKLFLDHVTSSLSLASEKGAYTRLQPSVATTATECVHEWARFWLQVMHELRRGVHLRKVSQTIISPEEYELLPQELAQSGELPIPVASLQDGCSGLPDNAREIILDFITSKQEGTHTLKLLPYMGDVENANTEETDIYEDDIVVAEEEITDSGESGIRHRKSLKVESPLWDKIRNWDASVESLLSDDKISRGNDDATPVYVLDEADNLGSRRHSYDLGDISPRRTPETVERRCYSDVLCKAKSLSNLLDKTAEDPNDANANTEHVPKKRLALTAQCFTEVSLDEDHRAVGTSLFEISKTRQAIATAEAEMLPRNEPKATGIKSGIICFGCRKSKFSLFTKAYQCHVCAKKFCTKCTIQNFEIPNHLVDTKQKGNKNTGMEASKGLSKSLSDLVTGMGENSITPFPCKRQSLLQISARRTYGGKITNMCQECKVFIDSILTETKNFRWHVGMSMDI